MATAANARRKFLAKYRAEYSDYKTRAQALENFTNEILKDAQIEVHKIEARAKEPESAHLKLLRKAYSRPDSQLTDKLGVRVITYYSEDVDRTVDVLRPHIEIDQRRSVDKRTALGLRAFGYSSVHIVARLRARYTRKSSYACLDGFWFEIQVRSILEHAWAEVEHEIVFKSGIDHPDSIVRRFAAIAGTLEVLGTEFASLRRERSNAIDKARQRYGHGLDAKRGFDSVRLLGFLEFQWPNNMSWRQAERLGKPFPPRIEATCVAALKRCNLGSAKSLTTLMAQKAYRRAVLAFAASELVKPEEVSHLALIAIAVAFANPRVLREYFPNMAENLSITAALTATNPKRK